ncbi:type II secretion system protein [Candidatus Microgenomates bacterium]|nr:type II secretion system protein [Candidatus Microgenomates bacterium]
MPKTNKKNGFTLIELLVATAIFATFVTVSSRFLVNVVRLEQKANVLRQTQQDTRYVLESIMREAKTANGEFDNKISANGRRKIHAYQYEPLTGTPNKFVIYTTDFTNNQVWKMVYSWSGGVVSIEKYKKSLGTIGATYALVSQTPLNDVNYTYVDKFSFAVSGLSSDLSLPPRVAITIEASSAPSKTSDSKILQAKTVLVSSATSRSY